MKKIIFIILTSLNLFSQENKRIIYVDNKEDYSVFIEKKTEISSQDIENNEIDIFVNGKDDVFNYTVIISKIINTKFSNGNLVNDDYEKYLKENCECSILSSEIVLYNNLKSLRYKIETQKEKVYFMGYIDSFVSNSVLYNVLFLAYDKDFNIMSSRYSDLMNTLIINGETTIDGFVKN